MSKEEEPKDVTSNEEKELRRVYDYLAHFAPKHKLRREMQPKIARRQKILQFKKNPDAIRIVDEAGVELTPEQLESELEIINEQIMEIEAQIAEIDGDPGKKVAAIDLMEALKALGKKSTKKEVEDMIWEVDENLDGAVDWEEFHLMFQRNIKDKTGLEPFQLFNVVQFMMYDRTNSSSISVDETMHMLYARYGKDRLEAEMKALFGDDLKADGDGCLTFTQYLKAVNVRLPKSTGKKKGSSRRRRR